MKRLIAACVFCLTFNASAATVTWTDWLSVTSWNGVSQTAHGQLVNGGDTVDIWLTSNSAFYGWALNGSPYWTGPAYTNGIVDNSPLGQDQIMLGAGGTATITFSQAIDTPLIAMNSWNSNVVNFSQNVNIDSYGAGYWGNGVPVNITSTGFSGSGEFHGVVAMTGDVTSFSMTHTTEYWHGLTIGVVGTSVPAPAALGVFAFGLLMSGRRRRQTAFHQGNHGQIRV
ncbi:MAG: hypothetical protein ACFHX7_15940 [Pseudomonadota bacterium]